MTVIPSFLSYEKGCIASTGDIFIQSWSTRGRQDTCLEVLGLGMASSLDVEELNLAALAATLPLPFSSPLPDLLDSLPLFCWCGT